MKIAIIYDVIYPYVIGGGEKRNWEIARRLVKNGHDVYLIGMKFWRGKKVTIRENVKLIGVCPAMKIYTRSGKRSFIEPFYFGFFLLLHLLFNSYDIIDCGNFPYLSCISSKIATIFKKTKFIITWHEIWGKEQWINYAGKLGVFGYFIEKIVSKLTSKNIFVSKFMRERALNALKMDMKNTITIPNGIEFYKLKNFRCRKKEPQIIYVGRLVQHKRVDILIDAFSEILLKFPNYILKIVGEGPEIKHLKMKAEKINKRVIFTGFLNQDQLYHEIAISKILVLPSEREGMGIVLIESMALGTPVIALNSKYSAAQTIIKNNYNGILFNNVSDLEKSLIKLLDDKKLYTIILQNGYATAKEYDWDESILPKIKEYYFS